MARFDGPIPGQSLTSTPRNAKWEKPPQFTNVNKAMDYLMRSALRPQMATRLITMLDNQIPVEAIVRTTLFAGFTEGTWNMDLAVLLAAPYAALLVTLYKKVTGKTPPMLSFDDGKPDPELVKLQQLKPAQSNTTLTEGAAAAIKSQYRTTGLMGAL